jgi:hypothetical protein
LFGLPLLRLRWNGCGLAWRRLFCSGLRRRVRFRSAFGLTLVYLCLLLLPRLADFRLTWRRLLASGLRGRIRFHGALGLALIYLCLLLPLLRLTRLANFGLALRRLVGGQQCGPRLLLVGLLDRRLFDHRLLDHSLLDHHLLSPRLIRLA